MSRAQGAGAGRAGRPAALAAALSAAGCSGGAFEPKGEGARLIAGGWWLMFALGTAVFVLVVALLLVALLRARRRAPLDTSHDPAMTRLVIWGGVVLPALVIALLVGVTVWMGDRLTAAAEGAVRIDVVGHQYWWDVEYPDLGVRTANEIHVPVDRPVELSLTSDDVIHSFWVPQLDGKIDLVPGRTTTFRLEAEEAGTYYGQCAEFCAIGHPYMRLLVIAEEAPGFEAWAEEQAEPAAEPTTEAEREGLQVFLGSSCVYCHRVEGTNATSEFGPDLTHLASRRTLAAATLPNTRGDLAGWILDPQRHKPGNEMPATSLEPEELLPLLDYLESLE